MASSSTVELAARQTPTVCRCEKHCGVCLRRALASHLTRTSAEPLRYRGREHRTPTLFSDLFFCPPFVLELPSAFVLHTCRLRIVCVFFHFPGRLFVICEVGARPSPLCPLLVFSLPAVLVLSPALFAAPTVFAFARPGRRCYSGCCRLSPWTVSSPSDSPPSLP